MLMPSPLLHQLMVKMQGTTDLLDARQFQGDILELSFRLHKQFVTIGIGALEQETLFLGSLLEQ